jgi:hypothetical protein
MEKLSNKNNQFNYEKNYFVVSQFVMNTVLYRIQSSHAGFFVEKSKISRNNYFYWENVVGIVEEKKIVKLIVMN